MKTDKRKSRKKKKKSTVEAELLRLVEKGLQDAMNAAMEELFKDWK